MILLSCLLNFVLTRMAHSELNEIELHSNWAVLIAGSNGYYNYRHQSDISHAYSILKNRGGYPPDRIITFMYNDIVNNSQNPYPGALYNEPNGINYYEGIRIDYTGSDVNAENFLKVIQGIEPACGGPVLKSTVKDNVFVYYSDHGATGLVAMPTGPPLYAVDLNQALANMYAKGMFNQLTFYLEACESGSMFANGSLSPNISVYATTASSPTESSYAFYYNNSLGTYMADEYSVRWMQDSEGHWTRNPLTMETLSTQFADISEEVTQSTPHEYGILKWSLDETVEEFQGYQMDQAHIQRDRRGMMVDHGSDEKGHGSKLFGHGFDYTRLVQLSLEDHREIVRESLDHFKSFCDSRNVKLCSLYMQLTQCDLELSCEMIFKSIVNEIDYRITVDNFFFNLVSLYVPNGIFRHKEIHETLYAPKSGIVPSNWDCLKMVVSSYESHCQRLDDYSLKYVRTLVNLCDDTSTSTEELVLTIARMCPLA